jgi:hypothetical protein
MSAFDTLGFPTQPGILTHALWDELICARGASPVN